jgi:hypothetical protein
MSKAELGCLPTAIGSMPQTGAAAACEQVLYYLKEAPAWPQLPHRSFLENMYAQFSQGFPGVVIHDEKIWVDWAQDLDSPLEQLYTAYLENDFNKFPVTSEYAAGLHQMLGCQEITVRAIKGQVTGPVSWGMTVADNNGRAIAYDEVLGDAVAKLLKLKASWIEKQLQAISKNTIIFVDEPYLHSIGSAFFALSHEKVIKLLDEVLNGIRGLKGIHCCGNTDWSVVLKASLDILSFDAYNYAQSLTLYPKEVKRFMDRGGAIAWGIVPNQEMELAKESTASLEDRLEEAMAPLTRKGIELPFRQLISQSLLTPSCTLSSLTCEASGKALELLVNLSERMRRKYG